MHNRLVRAHRARSPCPTLAALICVFGIKAQIYESAVNQLIVQQFKGTWTLLQSHQNIQFVQGGVGWRLWAVRQSVSPSVCQSVSSLDQQLPRCVNPLRLSAAQRFERAVGQLPEDAP